MSYSDDTKFFKARAKSKVKCKCGHSIYVPTFIDKVLCSWCGEYVFRDKKEQFKHDLLKNIKG